MNDKVKQIGTAFGPKRKQNRSQQKNRNRSYEEQNEAIRVLIDEVMALKKRQAYLEDCIRAMVE